MCSHQTASRWIAAIWFWKERSTSRSAGYKTVTEPARQPEDLAQGQAQEGGLGGTSIPHRLQVRKADRRRSGELG